MSHVQPSFALRTSRMRVYIDRYISPLDGIAVTLKGLRNFPMYCIYMFGKILAMNNLIFVLEK